MSGPAWQVEHLRGSAVDFHGRALPDPPERTVWWFEVERPAVALGSTQRRSVVDEEAASRAGAEVVRRRSGGGAVHLVPGEVTWVDVIIPAGDPRWEADLGRSFAWLGEAWAEVLAGLGVADVAVHEGPMQRTAWSDLVCFGGLGPGEVTVGGQKAVGLSQRRTRAAARFQCALLHVWAPGPLLDLLVLDGTQRASAAHELVDAARGIDAAAPAQVVERLLEVLARR